MKKLVKTGKAALPIGALLVLGGLVLPSCNGIFPPAPPQDEEFCVINAVPCATYKYKQCCVGGGCAIDVCIPEGTDPVCIEDSDCSIPIGCAGVICGGILTDVTAVPNPALCPTVLASTPNVGSRTCFMHGGNAAAGCTADCGNALNPGVVLDTTNWPVDSNLRSRCSSVPMGGVTSNGCNDPAPGPVFALPTQGTNVVSLSGSAKATLNGGSPTPAAITGGYFSITAPYTTCDALTSTCPTQLNEAAVDFADFSLDGHNVQGLKLSLDQPVLTPSGVKSGTHFLFLIPANVTFDAIATVDGNLTGLTVSSTQEVDGSIDLTTGSLAFQFDVSGTFDGKSLEVTGVATSGSVIATAPVLTETVTVTDSPSSCSATLSVTASATSAANLPVTITYVVDGKLIGTGAGASTLVSIGGPHGLIITATDTNGQSAIFNQVVNPTDTQPPVLACPGNQTIECTNGHGVATYTATATDNCGSAQVICAPPSGTTLSEGDPPTNVVCTATDAAHNTSTCSFTAQVVDTLPPTVTISNDGSGYSGTMWPPNHGYIAHTLADCVTGPIVDQCDGTLGNIDSIGKIVSITSDEPENAPGDGNTCADMVITGPTSFLLRAERAGGGDGRVYTVNFTVSDNDGNTASKSCSFQVPHDQSGSPAVAGSPVYCVGSGCGSLPGNNPQCR